MYPGDEPIDLLAEPPGSADLGMNAFSSRITDRILSVIRELPPGAAKCEVCRDSSDCHRVRVIPAKAGASEIELVLRSLDPPEVSIAAGENAYLSLETDLYRIKRDGWVDFLERIVRAIIDGGLQETTQYRGDVMTKSTFVVLMDGEPFRFTRTDVPNWLRNVFRRKRSKAISYDSYRAD